MKPVYERNCIQIEVTNNCNLKCPNCTRMIGHIKNPYYMDLDYIEKALKSLKGFKGIIGMMGGEPTLHPEFESICYLFQKYVPYKKRGLWTNGYRWRWDNMVYDEIIRHTFPIENIVYNAHDYEYKNQHQPALIPSWEIIKDKELWFELVLNCWVPERWSASINPKGGYFCEVAASLDMLYNLEIGWKIKEGWWNVEVDVCMNQIEVACRRCSMCIPFGKEKAYYSYSNPYTREDYEKFKIDWKPWMFRDFWQHEPEKRIYKKWTK